MPPGKRMSGAAAAANPTTMQVSTAKPRTTASIWISPARGVTRVANDRSRRGAGVRFFLEAALDDLPQRGREHCGRLRRRLRHHRERERNDVCAAEGASAGRQLEQNDAEAVEIRARVERPPEQLLR